MQRGRERRECRLLLRARRHPPDDPRERVNRAAHSLMPPLRLMNLSSGLDSDLYSNAYRSTRDHFDRVRLWTLRGSEVQRMIAANGSLQVDASKFCNRRAHRALSSA